MSQSQSAAFAAPGRAAHPPTQSAVPSTRAVPVKPGFVRPPQLKMVDVLVLLARSESPDKADVVSALSQCSNDVDCQMVLIVAANARGRWRQGSRVANVADVYMAANHDLERVCRAVQERDFEQAGDTAMLILDALTQGRIVPTRKRIAA